MYHILYYTPPENISSKNIILGGKTAHHIRNVLRQKTNDTIFVTDGQGSRYETKILDLTKSRVYTKILNKITIKQRYALNIELAFVPLKGARSDIIFEKGTELGVKKFILFISRFSVVPTLSKKKLERFRNITISAMLQSQQYYIPEIVFEQDINGFLEKLGEYDIVLLADRGGELDIKHQAKKVLYVVGPEGGFCDSEIEQFKSLGVRFLSLGEHRLRSETAALSGIVKILTIYKQI